MVWSGNNNNNNNSSGSNHNDNANPLTAAIAIKRNTILKTGYCLAGFAIKNKETKKINK